MIEDCGEVQATVATEERNASNSEGFREQASRGRRMTGTSGNFNPAL